MTLDELTNWLWNSPQKTHHQIREALKTFQHDAEMPKKHLFSARCCDACFEHGLEEAARVAESKNVCGLDLCSVDTAERIRAIGS